MLPIYDTFKQIKVPLIFYTLILNELSAANRTKFDHKMDFIFLQKWSEPLIRTLRLALHFENAGRVHKDFF